MSLWCILGYMMQKEVFSTTKGEDQQVIMPWSLDMYGTYFWEVSTQLCFHWALLGAIGYSYLSQLHWKRSCCKQQSFSIIPQIKFNPSTWSIKKYSIPTRKPTSTKQPPSFTCQLETPLKTCAWTAPHHHQVLMLPHDIHKLHFQTMCQKLS